MVKNWGIILLAIWCIITGLVSLFSLSLAGLGVLMGILILAAGILLLMGR
jgi:hypothetical protein